ncbi:MAG: phosphoribosylanthranilate isomerase, partial [Deltaproteobacteria bacterium]|nr:phosphoribosylanthranilate isomerase [Deltaproteobacteria bacterium]
ALALGPARVIRVFWPERQSRDDLLVAMDLWKEFAGLFLFDAGAGGGGHGRGIGAEIPQSPREYLLAGGLDPAGARAAWPSKDPMLIGFDLNSGLEGSPGRKDALALGEILPWRRD